MSSGMSDGLLDFVKVLMCLVVSAWMCVRFRVDIWVYYQTFRVSGSLIDSLRF